MGLGQPKGGACATNLIPYNRRAWGHPWPRELLATHGSTHSLLMSSSAACLLQGDEAEAGSTQHPNAARTPAGAGCMQKAGQGGHLVTSLGGPRAEDWGTSPELVAAARQG